MNRPLPPAAPDPLPAYAYRCVDRSWLTAWVARVVAPRVERWLPQSWSAHTITWVGSGSMWVLLAGVLVVPAGAQAPLGGLWAALLGGYCVLDHVDGCRARRRGTSGAWGEFLDHALDACHGAILLVALAAVSGPAVRPGVTAIALAGAGIATLATWLDQKWRGEIHLGQLGPVEAVLAATLYLLSWLLPEAVAWWGATVGLGCDLTRAEGFLLIGALGALVAAGSALVRSPGQAGRLGACSAIMTVVVLGGAGGAAWWAAGVAIAAATVDGTARIIFSHLTRRPAPWPDWAGAVLVAGAAWRPEAAPLLVTAMAIWSAGRIGSAWWQAARTLRRR